MAVVSARTKRFTAASPVTRYWLANCACFSVAGGGRGTVERVIADGDPYVATQLEIRHRRKVRRLPVSAVTEVVPEEQVLVVCGDDRASVRWSALGDATVVLAVALLAVAGWLVRAGKETVRLVRSLPWQQYGRSVRSVTTRLWQDISTRLSLLLTTSSGRNSARRSSKRARTTSST
ncbi:MAG TPA: hypothetical protein VMU72_01595 [Gaiellaceae bacterium]|nr:hypothetical protein [Gaiellaceae bacterium]